MFGILNFASELKINFPKEEYAQYVRNALIVDKELKSGQIQKELICQGNNLTM